VVKDLIEDLLKTFPETEYGIMDASLEISGDRRRLGEALSNLVRNAIRYGDGSSKVLLSAERITAPETDLLLTMNAYDTRLAAEKHLAKTCAYIPGVGVDFSRLDRPGAEDGAALRRELGIAPEDFVLIYAAEFSARKSQSVLLEAMKLLPERAQLVLCGDGETLQRCREQARQTGLAERVHFPGHISDMPRWYRMADAAVSASRIEGLPFNVMEAMYLGLPTVASNVKGHSDLIEDGVTGLLYPYGDAASCAACIRRLMDDAGLRVLLAGRGRESVLQYRLEAVLPRLLGYYLGRETSGAGSESP